MSEIVNWYGSYSRGWKRYTFYKLKRHRQAAEGTVVLGRWVLEESLIMKLGSTFLAFFFMLRPMIPLAIGIAIPDEHTRLACLESNALSCLAAAIGTANDDDLHQHRDDE